MKSAARIAALCQREAKRMTAGVEILKQCICLCIAVKMRKIVLEC
jgi:hypothetical protein